jgi:hypothetical protein
MRLHRYFWLQLSVAGLLLISVSCFDTRKLDEMVSSEPAVEVQPSETETPSETTDNDAPDEKDAPDPDAATPTLPDRGGAEEAVAEPPLQDSPRPMTPPADARRLDPEYDVWIDRERRTVLMDGVVSFREGPLEMFACTRGTKEHESVVSVNTKAFLVHAALLNLGAETGAPVQFLPEFRPPSGTEIDVQVMWEDEQGQPHTARAQDWVRNARTGEALAHPSSRSRRLRSASHPWERRCA